MATGRRVLRRTLLRRTLLRRTLLRPPPLRHTPSCVAPFCVAPSCGVPSCVVSTLVHAPPPQARGLLRSSQRRAAPRNDPLHAHHHRFRSAAVTS